VAQLLLRVLEYRNRIFGADADPERERSQRQSPLAAVGIHNIPNSEFRIQNFMYQ